MEETLEAGSSVARVVMKYGVNSNQVFKWRRLHEIRRPGTRAVHEVQLLLVRVAESKVAPSAAAHKRSQEDRWRSPLTQYRSHPSFESLRARRSPATHLRPHLQGFLQPNKVNWTQLEHRRDLRQMEVTVQVVSNEFDLREQGKLQRR